jgi:L-lactate dehydrogenase
MKVGIVGAGSVGAAAAFAMTLRGVATELVLVDVDEARADAEAADIAHATPFAARVRVSAGDHDALHGARVVVVAAGRNQHPGQSRLELVDHNADVIRDVVPRIFDAAPDAVIVVATNPVDPMTQLAHRLAAGSGRDERRVFGTGTTLDTARFRHAVARHLGVDPQHVHGYVVGEHGDSEVLAWSSLDVAGRPLGDLAQALGVSLTDEDRRDIEQEVVGAAQRIIAGKGSTAFGVAAAISRIADVVLRDQRAILTVTAPSEDFGCSLSLPRLLSGHGVVREVGITMSPEERYALERSGEVLRRTSERWERSGEAAR